MLKKKFEFFNEKNVILKFGGVDIKIMNWQIFDSRKFYLLHKSIINGKKHV